MSDSLLIDPAFKIPHCLIWIVLIAVIYPICRILYHVFIEGSGLRSSSKHTIVLLLISIVLSYSYLIITSIQTVLMFTNGNIPASICPFFAWYRMFSYTSGRVILYLYFISRSNDIFGSTYLAFSKCAILSLTVYILGLLSTLLLPSAIIYFNKQEWYIASDVNGNGSYCASASTGDETSIKNIFIWGSFNDLIYSIITISMMVSRLFLLLKDNERKKSHTSRYQFASSPKSRDRVFGIKGSPETLSANSSVVSDSAASGRRFRLSSEDGSSLNDSRYLPNIEEKRVSAKIGSKQIHIKKVTVGVTKNDAETFHKKTAGHNKLILLISKFFIILMSMVISSQMVLVLFLVFRDMVKVLYSLDTFINMMCLFMTFAFSNEYYNKYFCGKCCTPFCFPLIKTLALSLDEYEKKYKMTHNMHNWVCHNVCCIYCRCCCCASCRYCCFGESLSKEIYDLAKHEIELIIEQDIADKVSQSSDREQTY